MKIRFLQPYTDPLNPGKTFLPGWTAEFSDPDAQRLIDAGTAEQIDKDIRAKKTGVLMTECVPANAPESEKAPPKERQRQPVKDPGLRT